MYDRSNEAIEIKKCFQEVLFVSSVILHELGFFKNILNFGILRRNGQIVFLSSVLRRALVFVVTKRFSSEDLCWN